MPYEQIWFEAPKDESLPLYRELPPEYRELFSFGVNEATLSGRHEGKSAFVHHCRHCGGWVPGLANRFHEETLSPATLSGGSGHALHCRRCGREIAFLGMVS